MRTPSVLAAAALAAGCAASGAPQLFGGAYPQHWVPAGVETELYAHRCAGGGGCVVTQFWLASDPTIMNQTRFWQTVIRMYVDDEVGGDSAAVEFELYPGMGIGFGDTAQIPWAARHAGSATNSGIYCNVKVPFATQIRVTLTPPANVPELCKPGRPCDPMVTFFYVKGLEMQAGAASLLTLGDGLVTVPPSARLRVHRIANRTLRPLEFVTLASSKLSGAVYLVSMSFSTINQCFLEACFRAIVGANNNATRRKTIISSGSEEYFYSNWYFNSQPGLDWRVNHAPYYQFPGGGLTHYDVSGVDPPTPSKDVARMSAYHVHDSDPLAFSDGMEFIWRVGDTNAVDPSDSRKCVAWPDDRSQDGTAAACMPGNLTLTAHVFVYEWD